jgi:hypothetical protein
VPVPSANRIVRDKTATLFSPALKYCAWCSMRKYKAAKPMPPNIACLVCRSCSRGLAHPKARLEAITSRPLLVAGVRRLTQHASKSLLLLTLSHAAGDQIWAMIASIRKGLDHVPAIAPQLPTAVHWPVLVRYIVDKIVLGSNNRSESSPRFAAIRPCFFNLNRSGNAEDASASTTAGSMPRYSKPCRWGRWN